MGERLNGIQEVRGSIPLVSIPVQLALACLIDERVWRQSGSVCVSSRVGLRE